MLSGSLGSRKAEREEAGEQREEPLTQILQAGQGGPEVPGPEKLSFSC